MRPQLPFLLVFLALLRSATAVCVPRSDRHSLLPASHDEPTPLQHQHIEPKDHSHPSPKDSVPQVFHDIHDAVIQLCGRTDYPDICVSSIEPLLPGVTAVDLGVLLGLEVKALRAKAKEVQAKIEDLSKKPGNTARQASILQLCRDNYEDAWDDIESADKAVTAHDKGTADTMFSAVITDVETCVDGFADEGLETPLNGVDREIEKISSNCLAFRSLMP